MYGKYFNLDTLLIRQGFSLDSQPHLGSVGARRLTGLPESLPRGSQPPFPRRTASLHTSHPAARKALGIVAGI